MHMCRVLTLNHTYKGTDTQTHTNTHTHADSVRHSPKSPILWHGHSQFAARVHSQRVNRPPMWTLQDGKAHTKHTHIRSTILCRCGAYEHIPLPLLALCIIKQNYQWIIVSIYTNLPTKHAHMHNREIHAYAHNMQAQKYPFPTLHSTALQSRVTYLCPFKVLRHSQEPVFHKAILPSSLALRRWVSPWNTRLVTVSE